MTVRQAEQKPVVDNLYLALLKTLQNQPKCTRNRKLTPPNRLKGTREGVASRAYVT